MQSESSFSFSLSNFDDADVESPRQPNFPQKNKTSNLSYSKSDESHEEPLEARINRKPLFEGDAYLLVIYSFNFLEGFTISMRMGMRYTLYLTRNFSLSVHPKMS